MAQFWEHYFSTYLMMISFFLLKEQICTIYSCNINMKGILKDLEYDMQNISKWFKLNTVKPNPKNFQFMILGKSLDSLSY